MGSIDASRAGSSNIKSSSPLTGGKRLRELLKDPSNVVVCPGVFDGLSARLAVAAGFDALYMVRNVVSLVWTSLLTVGLDRCWDVDV
jgi:hypothetical protein